MIVICIIHFFPANIEINIEGLYNGSTSNDDGHGWAVASTSHGLVVGKSMDSDVAIKDFLMARAEAGPGSLALFHSRFATHGVTDEYNIHPFFVGEDKQTIMAHNGVLPSYWFPAKDDKRSDTRMFVDRTAPAYLNTATGVPSRRGGAEIGRRIGSGNKLVFLSVASGEPKVRIINASSGVHDGGAWYSNSGYLPVRYDWRSWGYGTNDYWSKGDRVSSLDSPIVLGGRTEAVTTYYSNAECDCCGAKGTVDMDTDVCDMCGVCLVCWNEEESCSCGWRASARLEEESIWSEQEIASGAWME